MKDKCYTIKKDSVWDCFHNFFPEMVIGASFVVNETKYNGMMVGATTVTMDSGTVYNIEVASPMLWCFYTNGMVNEFLVPDKDRNKLIRWERREKEILYMLEHHRKNKPGV
ncbi:hypothetical protein F485_gp236 [Aeromonas phage CC2]|uniref:Uncharacterized protein n=1 Tax=Aeromonas phage CC2 TaxID=1204516 RepID=I6X7R7_9CAUD|nr:hypothetical protein F485_gp236 [Aeromonas phage CC2]AFN39467.1 hypothetical protein CC2_059 [Aeromonas phage CC2]